MFCITLFFRAKEKADVDKMQNPSVKAFFKDQQEFDEKMSKEQVNLSPC